MTSCEDINSTEIAFLENNIQPFVQAKRWLKFCKTVYVQECNLYKLKPPLSNISLMLSQSTHADCFNTKQLTAYCISVILSILIVIANVIILAAFIKDHCRLVRSSNLPIISLAISDLLTGLTFLYSSTWNLIILKAGYEFDISTTLHYVTLRTNKYLCLTLDGPGFVFACMMSSVLSLGIIASDRYLAIFHSYQYPHWITIPRMATILVASWAISILVGLLPLFGWNNWEETSTCQLTKVMDYGYLSLWSTICFLSGLIILFIYIRIFTLARKHGRQIEASRVSNTTSTYSLPSTSESSTSGDQNKLIKDGRKNSQISATIQKISLDTSEHESHKGEHRETQSRKVGFKVQSNIAETSFSVTAGNINKDDQNNDDQSTSDAVNRNHSVSEATITVLSKGEQESDFELNQTVDLTKRTDPYHNFSVENGQYQGLSSPEPDSGIYESSNPKSHDKETAGKLYSGDNKTDYKRQSIASSHLTNRTSVSSTRSKPRKQARRPTMKAVRTTAMILGAFYVSWTPLLAYLLAFRHNYDNLTVYYLAVVTQVNSIFNPIMYGFRQSDIKKAVKRLFPCWKA